jgi:RNA-binding protein
MALSGADVRHLRALAHGLDPVVQLGKEGVTEALAAATARALRDHELIKVKILSEAPVDRHEAAEELAAATDSDVAQVIGRIVVLYRPHPDNPRIELPNKGVGGRAAEPKPEAEGGAAKGKGKAKKKSGIGARPKHKKRTLGRGGRAPKAKPEARSAPAPRPRGERDERGREGRPMRDDGPRVGGRGAARTRASEGEGGRGVGRGEGRGEERSGDDRGAGARTSRGFGARAERGFGARPQGRPGAGPRTGGRGPGRSKG